MVEPGSGVNHFGPQHCPKVCLNVYVWSYGDHNYKERLSFLKKLTCKGIWRQVFICLRSPPLCYTLYKYIPLYFLTQGRGEKGGGEG
jgi:hypothetical protein